MIFRSRELGDFLQCLDALEWAFPRLDRWLEAIL